MSAIESLISANVRDPLPPLAATPDETTMLVPLRAWQILCQRTGCQVCRATFYRWLRTGNVYSIRLGHHIFIPASALERVIKQCMKGQGF